jgi:hypothetical protein
MSSARERKMRQQNLHSRDGTDALDETSEQLESPGSNTVIMQNQYR